MFYVAGSKVYLTERNNTLGVYPEVKIVNGQPVIQDKGVAQKPPVRAVCTLEEVVVQFGRNYPKVTPNPSPRATTAAKPRPGKV